MELARRIKGPDELAAMRCAVHACEASMREIHDAISAAPPGMTERDLWSVLHAGNIRRAGEWVETQILSSGPRTNPWMQEASSRVIGDGDIVAYDTDLVGAYGMMVDVSRTRIAGDRAPNANQREVHGLARRTDRTEHRTPDARAQPHRAEPPVPGSRRPRRTATTAACSTASGQCDEYPDVFVPAMWDDVGYDDELEPGMVMTVEAFVGRRDGGVGAKLENQVLITDSGPELLTRLPLGLD